VLIHGEPGTGRSLVAHAIHLASPRREAPFIEVTSAAMPEGLLADELLGVEGEGAGRPGLLERAHGGSLFVHRIDEMPTSIQVHLLQALADREVVRQGSTERRRVEDMLRVALSKEREAVERLNELDRTKTDFVSTVSHELRTPITSVLGYTQMLQRGTGGALTEQQAKLLGRVESNGLRLQALIEDLLTLSRIEAGTFTLRMGPVDLRDVVARTWEATETIRHDRDLAWVVETGDVPVVVTGDDSPLTLTFS